LEHIGTGNFSTIFRGVSKKDGKTYAIKQAEKSKLQRLRKEADLFMEKHCLSKLKGKYFPYSRLLVCGSLVEDLPGRNSSLFANGLPIQRLNLGPI
jgi:serine/threonine protein kinase